MSAISIYRSKYRRLFEDLFKANEDFVPHYKEDKTSFSFKAISHFIDRMVDRNISFDCVKDMLMKVYNNKTAVQQIIDYIEDDNREHRLEITDGEIWLGCTVGLTPIHSNHLITLRMAFKNNNRIEGKIPVKVIKI